MLKEMGPAREVVPGMAQEAIEFGERCVESHKTPRISASAGNETPGGHRISVAPP